MSSVWLVNKLGTIFLSFCLLCFNLHYFVSLDPCENIVCDIPLCLVGYTVDVGGPGCCPTCKLDCSTVLCAIPDCPIPAVREDECCPVCDNVIGR